MKIRFIRVAIDDSSSKPGISSEYLFAMAKIGKKRLRPGFTPIKIGKKQVFDAIAKVEKNKKDLGPIAKNGGQKIKDKSLNIIFLNRLVNLLSIKL